MTAVRSAMARRPVLWALAAIMLLAIALRICFLVQYRPALLGYPDTADYILSARLGLLHDPSRVAGYVAFLRLLHLFSHQLLLVTIVQHALGIASGLLLFDAVRRTGAPAGVGLIPAAAVMLGGSELLLEHAILTEAVFIFCIDLCLWAIVRAWTGSLWWALAAGVALAAATIDRSTGLELLPFLILCLLLLTPARRRGAAATNAETPAASEPPVETIPRSRLQRLGVHSLTSHRRIVTALACLVGSVVVIVPYLYHHHSQTGSWGFTTSGDLALYGRVAPFADCTKFTPPAGTAKLCIHQPVSRRYGSQAWEFSPTSPAVIAYGGKAHPGENSQLESFAVAAIEGQPLTYLEYVGRDMLRIIDPSYSSSPYPRIGNAGYGYGPQQTVNILFSPSNTASVQPLVSRYYSSSGVVAGDVSIITGWEKATRLEGPAMVVILLLAIMSVVLAPGLPRRLAIVSLVTAVVVAAGPVFVLEYSYRYTVPAFGPLTVAAAIGAWQILSRGSAILRRRRAAAA
jgi:hypothetical protein